jgi:hypothetical protein
MQAAAKAKIAAKHAEEKRVRDAQIAVTNARYIHTVNTVYTIYTLYEYSICTLHCRSTT